MTPDSVIPFPGSPLDVLPLAPHSLPMPDDCEHVSHTLLYLYTYSLSMPDDCEHVSHTLLYVCGHVSHTLLQYVSYPVLDRYIWGLLLDRYM